MRKILITLFFDNNDELETHERDYDRFILECEEGNFRDKIFEVFDRKKYAWDDFEKIKKGYKPIMSTEQIELTDLEVIK